MSWMHPGGVKILYISAATAIELANVTFGPSGWSNTIIATERTVSMKAKSCETVAHNMN